MTHATDDSGKHNMEKHTIERDGLPPITFIGEKIASASNHSHQGDRQNRWTEVRIWRTKGGKYVACVDRLTRWQGERDTTEAKACATPQDVIDFLRDGEPTLGSVSQRAVEEAAKSDPAFADAWKEEVE